MSRVMIGKVRREHLQQAVDGLRRAGDRSYLPLGLLALRRRPPTKSDVADVARRVHDRALAWLRRRHYLPHRTAASWTRWT